MPEDVYFGHLQQFRAIHWPLFEHVIWRLNTRPRQLVLSFNQMSIYEYMDEHDEDYTYYTHSMGFHGVDATPDSRMILAINEEVRDALFETSQDRESIMDILQNGWNSAIPTVFQLKDEGSTIRADKLEVLLTAHFWDSVQRFQYFKLLYFSDTVATTLSDLGAWTPPEARFEQTSENDFTI